MVVVVEPVEVVPTEELANPGKTDGAIVALLIDPPNTEDVLLEAVAEDGFMVVRDGC